MHTPLKDIKILVADDGPLNLMLLTKVLTNAGAIVVTATNGTQVLDVLEEQLVDLVLMDLQMPELDGYETTRIIRFCGQPYSNIAIMAVTAETDPVVVKKCLKDGMNDFITKPFVPADIYRKIISLLQKQEATQTNTAAERTDDCFLSFDLTYLKEVTNGEMDSLTNIVNNLIENAPLLLQQSVKAAALQHWKEAACNLHKLKGLTTLFFMPEITTALRIAENESRAKVPSSINFTEQASFVSIQLPLITKMIVNELELI